MSFFEPVDPPPPRFDRDRTPLPWEDGLGRTVFTDVELATGPEGQVVLRNLVAFPDVMTLSVLALLRNPLVHGPGTRGHNCPKFGSGIGGEVGTGIVMFGLGFSDGSRFRNLDDRGSRGRLGSLRASGGSFVGNADFWAQLPPLGELELWVAWPAAQVPETRTVLDASPIRDAAAALRSPW